MRSRDIGILATCFDLAARLPLWGVLALAVVAFIGLDLLAHIAIPSAVGPGEAGPIVVRQVLKTAGEILRIVIPSALILGALVAHLRERKRRKLLNNSRPGPSRVVDDGADENPTCPRCASPMVKRTAKSGALAGQAFFGCSRYPACKGTVPIRP